MSADKAAKGGKVVPSLKQVNVFSEREQKHVLMTQEQSIRDTIKYHNGMDYSIASALYEQDKKQIDAAMKACNYRPVVDPSATEKPSTYTWRYFPPPQGEAE